MQLWQACRHQAFSGLPPITWKLLSVMTEALHEFCCNCMAGLASALGCFSSPSHCCINSLYRFAHFVPLIGAPACYYFLAVNTDVTVSRYASWRHSADKMQGHLLQRPCSASKAACHHDQVMIICDGGNLATCMC